MAYYSYKRIRDILISEGWIDEYGNPVNTEKYGDELGIDYSGNLWDMTADYIESLKAT